MANARNIRFLRNGNLYASANAARNALNSHSITLEQDGTIILARYGSSEAPEGVKTLAGFVYSNGTSGSLTIFDVEGSGADVDEKIQEVYDTIGNEFNSGHTVADAIDEINEILGEGFGTGNTVTDAIDEINGAIDEINEKLGDGFDSANTVADAINDVNDALGEGFDAGNTVADAIDDLKGNTASTSADTSIEGAKKYADEKDNELEEKLKGDTASTGSEESIAGAKAYTDEKISGLSATSVSADGKVIINITQDNGKISATTGDITDITLNSYSKDSSTGAITSADTINSALSKIENSINAAADIKIEKVTTGLPETIKESYKLLASDDSQLGDSIDIPKDSHIVSINYITTGENAQNLEYVYVDVSGNTQTTYVDMSELVLETEFASGITVTDGVAHGVVDTTSEKDSNNAGFLTVGADGFKVNGIKDEIDAKINPLSGKTVTEIISSNSSISAVSASATDGTVKYDVVTDASKIKMVGFTADTSGFTGITTATSVSDAVKEIEASIINNEQVVSSSLNDLNTRVLAAKSGVESSNIAADSGETAAIVVTESTGTDGQTIYTLQLGTIDCGTY